MRAVLWCNGSAPSRSVIDSVVNGDVSLYGVDGGAEKASECGFDPIEAIGDLDSLDIEKWQGAVRNLPGQSSSDLAKSIGLLIEEGFEEIDVVGVEGGSPDHLLGNWAALSESPHGAIIRLHHEEHVTRRLHPEEGGVEMEIGEGVIFSVFALGTGKVWLQGARWELTGEVLSFSTRGLHNEGIGGLVSIRSEVVLAVVTPR